MSIVGEDFGCLRRATVRWVKYRNRPNWESVVPELRPFIAPRAPTYCSTSFQDGHTYMSHSEADNFVSKLSGPYGIYEAL